MREVHRLFVTAAVCSSLVSCGGEPMAMEWAERLRGLELVAPVNEVILTPAEIEAETDAVRVRFGADALEEVWQRYGRMGLMDRGLDLSAEVGVGSFAYSPDTQTLSIAQDTPAARVVGYAYVLVDQHFGLDWPEPTTDARLAHSALARGDLDIVLRQFSAELFGREEILWWGNGPGDPALYDIESYLERYGHAAWMVADQLFGGAFGTRLVIRYDADGSGPDWPAVNQLHRERRPRTTREVIEWPGAVDVPADPFALAAWPPATPASLMDTGRDSLGQFLFHLILSKVTSPEEAWYFSSTWRGDTVVFVKDEVSGEQGFVWVVEWLPPEPPEPNPYDPDPPQLDPPARLVELLTMLHAQDEENVVVEVAGNRILVIRNVPEEHVQAFRDEALTP